MRQERQGKEEGSLKGKSKTMLMLVVVGVQKRGRHYEDLPDFLIWLITNVYNFNKVT